MKFDEQANEDVINSPLNPFFCFWDDLISFAKVLLQLLAACFASCQFLAFV